MTIHPQEALDEIMAAAEQDPAVVREVARRLVIPVMGKLYHDAMDQETGSGIRLSIFKEFALIGELYPKKDALPVAQSGSKFSVVINIPQVDGKPHITVQGTVIEGEAVEADSILADPMPSYITFQTDNDLTGVPDDAQRP
jgi:hypothetical protein